MESLDSYKQFKVGNIYIHKNPLDIVEIKTINKHISPLNQEISYIIEFLVLETNYEEGEGLHTMYYSCMKDSYYPFKNTVRKL